MALMLLTSFLALLMVGILLYTFGQWIAGVLGGIGLDRQGMLHNSWATVLAMRGWNATAATLFAPLLVFFLVYGLTRSAGGPPDMLFAKIVLIILLVCFFFCLFLWPATLYLRFRPKQPYYLFHLPGDADLVRIDNCKKGIIMANLFYPKMPIETAWIDAFVRAMHVNTRIVVFPKGKKDELQFTNDFGVCCDLAVEGFERGYHGFVALCDADPEHLEAERAKLAGWPEDPDAKALVEKLAKQIMQKDEGKKE